MQQPAGIEALDLSAIWAADAPSIDLVLPGLARGTVGVLVAAGGSGKSTLMLATVLGLAIGRDVGRAWGYAPTRNRGVFLSLEDPEVVLRKRLHALRAGLSGDERASACERMSVLSCAGLGLSLASPTNAGPRLTPWFHEFARKLAEWRPRLVVVDTLNRALGGLPENGAGAMGKVIGEIERLARDVDCAVVLCHHVSKQASALGGAGEAHAARGSSVITDNARWQCNLSVPGDGEAQFAGMPEAERRRYARLHFAKVNYEAPIAARLLRRDDDGLLSSSQDADGPDGRGRAGAAVAARARPRAKAVDELQANRVDASRRAPAPRRGGARPSDLLRVKGVRNV